MKSPEQIFKLQTHLGTWSGTHKIAGWLVVVSVALSLVGAVLFFMGKENSLSSALSPLGVATVCSLLRREAKEKMRSLAKDLS